MLEKGQPAKQGPALGPEERCGGEDSHRLAALRCISAMTPPEFVSGLDQNAPAKNRRISVSGFCAPAHAAQNAVRAMYMLKKSD